MTRASMLAVCLVLSLGAMADGPVPPAEESMTHSILEHHWKTFTDNDLEGVLADYTETSVVITPRRTYRGLKEIRENFVAAYGHFPKQVSTLTLTRSVVHEDVGYIIWNARGPTGRLVFATDTLIVRSGKIVSQTFGVVDAPP